MPAAPASAAVAPPEPSAPIRAVRERAPVAERALEVREPRTVLDRFAPRDGWSEQYACQLKARMLIVDFKPCPTEAAFLENLDSWVEARSGAEENDEALAQL